MNRKEEALREQTMDLILYVFVLSKPTGSDTTKKTDIESCTPHHMQLHECF